MNEIGGRPEPKRRKEQVRFTRRQRIQHVRIWESSGLSGAEYGRRNGIDARNLYRWRDRVWNRRGKGESTGRETAQVDGPGSFVSIDVERSGDAIRLKEEVAQDGRGKVAGALPGLRVVLRRAGLEVELIGADATQLAAMAGALRREVWGA